MAYVKSWKYALAFGFLIWLIPFFVSFPIFALRESNRPLFESIMPLALAITTVLFAIWYFKDVDAEFVKEGIVVGVIWYLIPLIIDLTLFLPPGPMNMSFIDYMYDIGITYFIIPTITMSFGCLINQRKA